MSVVKQRLQRFNGSSYDTIHLETEKACITDFTHTHQLADLNMINQNVTITDRSELDDYSRYTGVIYVNIGGAFSTVLCFHILTNSIQLETLAFNYIQRPLMRVRIYRRNIDDGVGNFAWSSWYDLVPYDA